MLSNLDSLFSHLFDKIFKVIFFQFCYFLSGHSDIALYGPFYVPTADIDDGPSYAADESPLSWQHRNSERIFINTMQKKINK